MKEKVRRGGGENAQIGGRCWIILCDMDLTVWIGNWTRTCYSCHRNDIRGAAVHESNVDRLGDTLVVLIGIS